MKKLISIRVDPGLHERIRRLAKRKETMVSEQYRHIVETFFENWIEKIFK